MFGTIKYHKRLNPKIWVSDEQLDPVVAHALIAIAVDFVAFMHGIGFDITDKHIRDILFHGSNTNYYYDGHSDIDVAIVADLSGISTQLNGFEVFKLNKPFVRHWKRQFGKFNIRGMDVDVTMVDVDHAEMAPGWYKVGPEYSLVDNCWRHAPVRIPPDEIDQIFCDAHKRVREIEQELKMIKRNGGSFYDYIRNLQDRRFASMHAQYWQPITPETVAFKTIRNRGIIKRLMRRGNKQLRERFNVK